MTHYGSGSLFQTVWMFKNLLSEKEHRQVSPMAPSFLPAFNVAPVASPGTVTAQPRNNLQLLVSQHISTYFEAGGKQLLKQILATSSCPQGTLWSHCDEDSS